MELYIGINFLGHDTAIFVINPSQKSVFAISTERLTRFKHDTIFPVKAIEKYLEQAKIDPSTVSKIVCSNPRLEHESLKLFANEYERSVFYRTLFNEPYLKGFLAKQKRFKQMAKWRQSLYLLMKGQWRKQRQLEKSTLTAYQFEIQKRLLSAQFPNAEIEVKYFDHEYCHAVSGFMGSPMANDQLLITMDAQGDHNLFSSVYKYHEGNFELITQSASPKKLFTFSGKYTQIQYESSIGGLYTYFTHMLGYAPNADEGKVEALAAFGSYDNPIYHQLWECFSIQNHQIKVHQEKIELYFSIDVFDALLTTIKKEDIAAAIQKFLENFVLQYVQDLINLTGIKRLCLSGGVFANVILNMRIFEEITSEIHIVPAMTDEGTAEGAAYLAYMADEQDWQWLKAFSMPYFGSAYSQQTVESVLKKCAAVKYFKHENDWPEMAAKLVAEGQIGALFHGRMEWGPRALGNRSIIADCRDEQITKKINGSIKNRPLFQPFCPSILLEERERLFDRSYPNKHMTCAFKMKSEFRAQIPAAVHIDGTARAQFVDQNDNPNYYRYLSALKAITGFGVSINTSFNKHGRTIVETPEDALRDFLDTNLDFMMIEGFLVQKA